MLFKEYVMKDRSPEEVFKDHLRLRQGTHAKVDEDLKRNFSNSVVVKTNFGNFEGKDGVRKCATILREQLPCAKYKYKRTYVNGNTAKLWWSGDCDEASVDDGYDVFTIENGKIIRQEIHYTVRKK